MYPTSIQERKPHSHHFFVLSKLKRISARYVLNKTCVKNLEGCGIAS